MSGIKWTWDPASRVRRPRSRPLMGGNVVRTRIQSYADIITNAAHPSGADILTAFTQVSNYNRRNGIRSSGAPAINWPNISVSSADDDDDGMHAFTNMLKNLTSTPQTNKSSGNISSAPSSVRQSAVKSVALQPLPQLVNQMTPICKPSTSKKSSTKKSTVIKKPLNQSVQRKSPANSQETRSFARKSFIPEYMERTVLDASPYGSPFTPMVKTVKKKRYNKNNMTCNTTAMTMNNNTTYLDDNTTQMHRSFKSTTTQTNDSLRQMSEVCDQTFDVPMNDKSMDQSLHRPNDRYKSLERGRDLADMDTDVIAGLDFNIDLDNETKLNNNVMSEAEDVSEADDESETAEDAAPTLASDVDEESESEVEDDKEEEDVSEDNESETDGQNEDIIDAEDAAPTDASIVDEESDNEVEADIESENEDINEAEDAVPTVAPVVDEESDNEVVADSESETDEPNEDINDVEDAAPNLPSDVDEESESEVEVDKEEEDIIDDKESETDEQSQDIIDAEDAASTDAAVVDEESDNEVEADIESENEENNEAEDAVPTVAPVVNDAVPTVEVNEIEGHKESESDDEQAIDDISMAADQAIGGHSFDNVLPEVEDMAEDVNGVEDEALENLNSAEVERRMSVQSNEGQLRRSKRNKQPIMEFWRGQRLIYKRESNGITEKIVSTESGYEDVVKPRKQKSNKGIKRKLNFTEKIPTNIFDLSLHKKVKTNKRKSAVGLIKTFESLLWKVSNCNQGVDIAIVTKNRSKGEAIGMLRLQSEATKKTSKTSDYVTHLTVTYGALLLKLEDHSKCIVKTGDSFTIGSNASYSLTNLRKDIAYLSFTVLKD